MCARPQVSVFALLVFQVFLIIHYQPLVHALADVILNGDLSVFTPQTDIHSTQKATVTYMYTDMCTTGTRNNK